MSPTCVFFAAMQTFTVNAMQPFTWKAGEVAGVYGEELMLLRATVSKTLPPISGVDSSRQAFTYGVQECGRVRGFTYEVACGKCG